MSQSIETKRPVVLTVAGFDPSCGAGITADLKAIAACGCYGIASITAITIQNTVGVNRVIPVEPLILIQQIECLMEDIRPAAIKIGMLATKGNVEALERYFHSTRLPHFVIDPVMCSSSGAALLADRAIDAFRSAILPLADCLTPNIDEAEILTGLKVRNVEEMKKAAEQIVALGSKAVVITGGHLIQPTDVLFDGEAFEIFTADRVGPPHSHGTGCTFSSALASFLARGCSLKIATSNAKNYVTRALQRSYPIGRGRSPLNHFPD